IKVSSIADFIGKVQSFMAKNPALGLFDYLKSGDNSDYTFKDSGWAPEVDRKPSYAFGITSEPFVIDRDMNLLKGEISVSLSTQHPTMWKYPYNFPPIGTLVQFEVGVEMGYQVKTETTTGMKVDNNDLKTMGKEFKLTIEGVLKAYGNARFVFGTAGVIGSAEANLGVAIIWPVMTNPLSPSIEFPMSVGVKIQTYQLWEFFTQDVYGWDIFKTSNILYGPYEWNPPEVLSRGAMSIVEDDAGNNTFITADNLGIVTGQMTERNLRLEDALDRDYYRFRTIETGGAVNEIRTVFTGADPAVSGVLYDAEGFVVAEMSFVDATNGVVSLHGLGPGEYVFGLEGDELLGIGYDLRINAPESSLAALVADLDVAGAPFDVAAGEVLVYTVTVTNAGGAASPVSEGALLWSRDAVLDSGDGLLVPAFAIPALSPGQSWTGTFNAALPAAALGPVTVGVVVDRRDQVPEAYRGDNTVTWAMEVVREPDRYEPNDNIFLAPHLGGLTSTRMIEGLNLASTLDIDLFRIQLPEPGTNLDAFEVRRSGSGPVNLFLAGEDGSILSEGSVDPVRGVARVSLEGMPAGEYLVVVRSAGDAGFDYTLALLSAERSGANLAVEDVVPGSGFELIPGTDRTARVLLSNYGNMTARSFTVGLVLEHQGVEYALADPFLVDFVRAGETKEVVIPISVPDLTGGGYVTVRATVDAGGTVAELNEEDNFRTVTILLAGTPDAEEETEYLHGYTDAGVVRGTVNISGRNFHSVYDQDLTLFRLSGTAGSGHQVTVAFDGAMGDIHAAIYNEDMVSAAGAVKVEDGSYLIDLNGLEGGAYFLMLRSFEGAFPYEVTITAPDEAGPNLTVASFSVVDPRVADGSLEVSAIVENVGDQATGSFAASYHVSTSPAVGPSDPVLASFTVAAGLGAGGSAADGPRTLDLGHLAPGIYYVGLVVDGAGDIPETVEGDNITSLRVVVLPPADAFEENDSRDSATQIQLTGGTSVLTGLNLHNVTDVDYFRLDLPGKGGAHDIVTLSYVAIEPNLKLSIFNYDGMLLRSVSGFYGTASVSLSDLEEGRYFIVVEGDSPFGFSTGYTLTVNAAGAI
ncbi:MAG TPA: hypothetical protein ENN79_07850, partial [Desulfobacteraceae bacterium]|nr:hypothetical protein [Desulfobacteraceae bacterium]